MTSQEELNALQAIDNSLREIALRLSHIQNNTKTPEHFSTQRISMPTTGKWYPVIVPKFCKMWFVQAIPNSANLKIAYGETDNLSETPPPQYTTIPAVPTNGNPSQRIEFTRPKLIFLQTDAACVAEMEIWV